jgi:K(+)-stimulated pyrophosphate-energized sodium pump
MKKIMTICAVLLLPLITFASEADLLIPELNTTFFGGSITGSQLLLYSSSIILLGLFFGLWQFTRIKNLPVHRSMANVSHIIYETCKTYLLQQGRFLLILLAIIGSAIFYYFYGLSGMGFGKVLLVLLWTVLGIAGSYGVAWFGIRINTFANSRTSFASLRSRPWDVVSIPLQAGMSVGLLLICVELILMLVILLFVPAESAGACFVGFAIGESLGASALRIAGGIFTKIADIGADLMKIVFNIGEDDPRNPGVIADCTGDNAGDSVGPTADGFETYGVTGVALISFIVLAVADIPFQSTLIVWIFMMRILMVFTSIFSYAINQAISSAKYKNAEKFNFENPLTSLVWITSVVSIVVTYIVSYFMLADLSAQSGVMLNNLWWQLASIISCGTLAAAVIPELVKAFTSSKSRHVNEVVVASREGGASLTILSGLVAGNFSAFWLGIVLVGLMFLSFFITTGFAPVDTYTITNTLTSAVTTVNITIFGEYPAIFAFGLVAFGFLGMGPVTIAVDSYGPVTDNAQSVFELSQIESIEGIHAEIKRDFGFDPDFVRGKHYLEENDSAGNTFKATAKPVLIGTAVIGATTMIFAIILLLKKYGLLELQLMDPMVILGFITGGAVVYWFTGASIQAVTTGAYRAVEFIKQNIRLDKTEADIEDSKAVVKICTKYAQAGMWNIFAVIFSLTLAFAFFDPNFFVSYLISIAVFGLFQAMYMANAGGAWDNAKKVVEVDLKEKNTDLHAATVVGDTVGDPYKDTSSVALNPIIKFSTLFGLLAAEISIHMIINARETGATNYSPYIGVVFLLVGLFFVYRSFYGMRIKK